MILSPDNVMLYRFLSQKSLSLIDYPNNNVYFICTAELKPRSTASETPADVCPATSAQCKHTAGTSLGVRWLRRHAPPAGAQVRSLVGE